MGCIDLVNCQFCQYFCNDRCAAFDFLLILRKDKCTFFIFEDKAIDYNFLWASVKEIIFISYFSFSFLRLVSIDVCKKFKFVKMCEKCDKLMFCGHRSCVMFRNFLMMFSFQTNIGCVGVLGDFGRKILLINLICLFINLELFSRTLLICLGY